MKLNYRDKVILGILLALVILIASFFLLIKPKNQDIKDNRAKLEKVQQERDEIDGKIAEIKPLKTEIQETYDDTTGLTDDFVEYNDIYNARKLDQYMQHFAEECEVKVKTLSAGDLGTGNLKYYYFKPSFLAEDMLASADLNGDRQDAIKDRKAESEALSSRTQEKVLTGNYTISVTGTQENIWNYLQAIEEQDKTIIINSVSLSNATISKEALEKQARALGTELKNDEEEPEVTANLSITLYSVYELSEPNLEAD